MSDYILTHSGELMSYADYSKTSRSIMSRYKKDSESRRKRRMKMRRKMRKKRYLNDEDNRINYDNKHSTSEDNEKREKKRKERRLNDENKRSKSDDQSTTDNPINFGTKHSTAKDNKSKTESSESTSKKEQSKEYDDIANRVLKGEFGNGKDRQDKLTKAGYDWAEVQNRVNEKLGVKTRHKTNDEETPEKETSTKNQESDSQQNSENKNQEPNSEQNNENQNRMRGKHKYIRREPAPNGGWRYYYDPMYMKQWRSRKWQRYYN